MLLKPMTRKDLKIVFRCLLESRVEAKYSLEELNDFLGRVQLYQDGFPSELVARDSNEAIGMLTCNQIWVLDILGFLLNWKRLLFFLNFKERDSVVQC